MAPPEMFECIFFIGQYVSNDTSSWMISLLDYSRVKAVTIFDFEKKSVILHEAGGTHPLKELEKRVKEHDKDLMVMLMKNYLIELRTGIHGEIFPGEPLPQVAFISISSHSFMTGISPRYNTPGGAISYTAHLRNLEWFSVNRDKIRKTLSPDCVIKLWGCQGIEGNDLPARTTLACLQLDWDEKQGNTTFFDPKIYSPPPLPLDHPDHDSERKPTFFEIIRRNRKRLDPSLTEEFDHLTARNIIKCIFLGENPALTIPEIKDTSGTVLENAKRVKMRAMIEDSFYPVALALFLDRPVIASRFGVSAEKHAILPEKLSRMKEIRDANRPLAFPGLDGFFEDAGDKITMPVDVDCEVLDLLISRWVTPNERILVPVVLRSLYFPSERYVVYRPDIKFSLRNVEYMKPDATPERAPILEYQGKDVNILESKYLLDYPSIKDYS